MRKQPKPKHWRTREQFVEAERKARKAKRRTADEHELHPGTCSRCPGFWDEY